MSEVPTQSSAAAVPSLVGTHDLATLSAVADFVINLSIGARNQQIYGATHPTAVRGFRKMEETLAHALRLSDPLELHFTPEAIFCGVQCLERGHPIYRRFADRMWRLGIVGLSIRRGICSATLVSFLSLLNRSRTENWSRRETEGELRRANLVELELEFLHELVSYKPSEEVAQISSAEQEELWEGFMAQLAQFRALGPDPESRDRTPATDSEVRDPDSGEGYAEAVIDYLKQLERSKRQDLLMAQTDFGRKVAEFLTDVNPNLRHQIMSSALKSPEISPDTLQRLVNLAGQDQLIDSLQQLNRSGEAIPPTAFRALSLLSMVRGDEVDLSSESSTSGSDQQGPEIRRLLDGLMAADRATTYTSPEYERTIQNIQSHARRLVQDLTTRQFELSLSPNEAEKHFLLAAEQTLDHRPEDPEIAASVDREAEASYTYFIEAGIPSQCRAAMELARRARRLAGHEASKPYVWETETVLAPLAEQLTGSDRWQSEDSSQLLTTIGSAAVPPLIDILLTSDSISARKRTLAALISMLDDPAPQLLPYLHPDQPWYVQRNVIHVLRHRRNPSGLEAAKRCWKTRKRRLQLEILAYLLTLEDPEGTDYLWRALHHPDGRMVLDVFRVGIKTPTTDVVETLEQRIDSLPSVMIGSRYHLSMLRFMAQCESPRARQYVERSRNARQPLFSWTRRRFQTELDDILHE